MATLYLHIGTAKTGSTAIQSFLEANGAALARRGYDFPLLPYKYKGTPLRRNAHFLVAPPQREDGSFERSVEERTWRGRVARLAKQFRRFPNIVLTDEAIWNRTEIGCRGLWGNLKREADALGFDVRIIVYLRRQDQFMSSLWAQSVKMDVGYASKLCWEEALVRADERIALDYYRHLEEIAAHFGRDCIDVRIYDRKRFPEGDVRLDFLDVLGLAMEEDYKRLPWDRNPSLWGDALELKRIVNNLPGVTRAQRKRAGEIAVACYALERKQRTYSMFSDAELAAFLKRYEESNRLVARDYLGDAERPLFEAPGPQPPKWEPESPHMRESVERFLNLAATHKGDTRLAWLRRFARRNFERALRAVKGC